LSTGERLLKWGFKGDVLCVLCRSGVEGRDPMFFQCRFISKRIWREALKRCSVNDPCTEWEKKFDVGFKRFEKQEHEGNNMQIGMDSGDSQYFTLVIRR
jgi:hypothetical protein